MDLLRRRPVDPHPPGRVRRPVRELIFLPNISRLSMKEIAMSKLFALDDPESESACCCSGGDTATPAKTSARWSSSATARRCRRSPAARNRRVAARRRQAWAAPIRSRAIYTPRSRPPGYPRRLSWPRSAVAIRRRWLSFGPARQSLPTLLSLMELSTALICIRIVMARRLGVDIHLMASSDAFFPKKTKDFACLVNFELIHFCRLPMFSSVKRALNHITHTRNALEQPPRLPLAPSPPRFLDLRLARTSHPLICRD